MAEPDKLDALIATVALLHTIANDHETRPRRLEAIVEDLSAA